MQQTDRIKRENFLSSQLTEKGVLNTDRISCPSKPTGYAVDSAVCAPTCIALTCRTHQTARQCHKPQSKSCSFVLLHREARNQLLPQGPTIQEKTRGRGISAAARNNNSVHRLHRWKSEVFHGKLKETAKHTMAEGRLSLVGPILCLLTKATSEY